MESVKKFIYTIIIILLPIFLFAEILPPSSVIPVRWDDSIEIIWQDAISTTPVAHYIIYRATYENLNETYYDVTLSTGTNVTRYVDSLINTFDTYYYAVQTVDNTGNTSSLSAVKMCLPYNLTITAFNSKNFLKWNDKINSSGFNIYRSTAPNGNFTAIAMALTASEYLDTAVLNGITYYYKLGAIHNSSEAPLSATKSAMPFVQPFPPKNLSYSVSVDISGNTNVIINWSKENTKGTYPLNGFKIYRSKIYDDENDFSGFSTSTGYIDTVPAGGYKYYYKIKTEDIAGNTSAPVYFSVYISGQPSSPENLTITSAELTSVNLSWDFNSSYENVTAYVVYRSTDEQIGITSFNYYADSITLTPGTTINYYVRALNAYGLSDFSNAVTLTVKPKRPINFNVFQDEPDKVKLKWDANGINENISIYNIYRVIPPSTIDPDTPYYVMITDTVSGIIEFIDVSINTGTFYCYAVAGVTTGAYSEYVTGSATAPLYITPVSIPSIPLNLTITAFNSYVRLNWDKNDENEMIKGYNIFRSTDDVYYQNITITAQNYYYDTGLNTNTVYYYKINAENYLGWASTLTAYVSVTPFAANLIDRPLNVTVKSRGDGYLFLQWAASKPEDYVTQYNIYRSTNSGIYDTAPYSYTQVTYYTDTSVTAGTEYFYIIKAYGLTESAASDEVSGIPFFKPYPPINVEIENLHNKVFIKWSKPGSYGTYQSINQYNIYKSTSPGNFNLIKSKITDNYYIDSSVNTGFSYYYKIKSVDTMDNEDTSEIYYSINLTDISFPPGAIVAYAGENWVTLNWQRVTMTADSYNIYKSTVSGYYGEPYVYSLSVNTYKEYTDYNVQRGITYYYTITAVNAAGEGPKSNEIEITPYMTVKLPDNSNIRYSIENKKNIHLYWDKAIDGDYAVIGYNVLRSKDGGAYYETLGFVTATATPDFLDDKTEWNNIYYYLIKTVDSKLNQDATYPVLKVELPLPENKIRVFANLFDLSKNDRLKLRYQSIKSGKVKIKIYTLSGIFVRTLLEEDVPEGTSAENPYESQDFYWDGKNDSGEKVASGVYIILLETKDKKVIAKVAVVK